MRVPGGISDKPNCPRENLRDSESGFTLLEVLVALGILGMALSVLFAMFTTALDRTQANKTRVAAEHLAEALLLRAETSDPEALHDSRGTAAPTFEWTIKTTPYGSDADRQAWQGAPLHIRVDVQWNDHGRARTVSLSTLRIVPGGEHG
jgi:prepilin-type N-terminal cleavage/methylation domain-containing protein